MFGSCNIPIPILHMMQCFLDGVHLNEQDNVNNHRLRPDLSELNRSACPSDQWVMWPWPRNLSYKWIQQLTCTCEHDSWFSWMSRTACADSRRTPFARNCAHTCLKHHIYIGVKSGDAAPESLGPDNVAMQPCAPWTKSDRGEKWKREAVQLKQMQWSLRWAFFHFMTPYVALILLLFQRETAAGSKYGIWSSVYWNP